MINLHAFKISYYSFIFSNTILKNFYLFSVLCNKFFKYFDIFELFYYFIFMFFNIFSWNFFILFNYSFILIFSYYFINYLNLNFFIFYKFIIHLNRFFAFLNTFFFHQNWCLNFFNISLYHIYFLFPFFNLLSTKMTIKKMFTSQPLIHWHATFMNSHKLAHYTNSMIIRAVNMLITLITIIHLSFLFVFNCNFYFFSILIHLDNLIELLLAERTVILFILSPVKYAFIAKLVRATIYFCLIYFILILQTDTTSHFLFLLA
jgi:hypothetical protein